MTQEEMSQVNSGGVNFIDRGVNVAKRYLQVKNQLLRELLAEMIGTAFLILLGETGAATDTLSRHEKGNTITSNLSWGFGVFFAILMAGNISGGHFNPAISVTFALIGRTPWKKVIPYCLAQTLGAFLGAALVFALYYDAINAFDGGVRQIDGPNGTASIFATYPLEELTTGGAIFDQIVGTAGLVIAVLAATDPNNGLPQHCVPFAIALYVTVNGFTFAYNAGAAINPARDLGPRILTAIAGWGPAVFSYRNYMWFWMPIVFPIVGGIVGAMVYYGFVGMHHPQQNFNSEDTPPPQVLPCGNAFKNDAVSNSIYLSQQSIEFLEYLGKRDSAQRLVL